MAPLSLSDLQESDTTVESTETESESEDEVPSVTTRFTADEDRIRAVREAHSDDAFENIVSYAEKLAEDDKLQSLAEEYRQYDDMKRIRMRLYDLDGDYSTWLTQFWYGKPGGDSDDFTNDSYNGVQSAARDAGVNLYYHRMIAPEPIPEHFPGEAVAWQEFESHGFGDDEQDTDIFVTKEWAEEHLPFAQEIDGEKRPLPPTDSQLSEMSASSGSSSATEGSDSDLPFDPTDLTLDQLREKLGSSPQDDFTSGELEAVLDAEEGRDDQYSGGRKQGIKAIKGALQQVRDSEEQASLPDESDSSDDDTITVIVNGKEVTGTPDDLEAFLDD